MEYISPLVAVEPEPVEGSQRKANDLGTLANKVGAQLRLAGELTQAEVDLLDDLGEASQFGDEGSISQRLRGIDCSC